MSATKDRSREREPERPETTPRAEGERSGRQSSMADELGGIVSDVHRLVLLESEHVKTAVRSSLTRLMLVGGAVLVGAVVLCTALVLALQGAAGALSAVLGLPLWSARLIVGAAVLVGVALAGLVGHWRADHRRAERLRARLRVVEK